METFYEVLALLGAALIVWFMYKNIKYNPEQFSKNNLSKSFSLMGILALILIGFVTLLIFMVRTT